MAEAAPVKITVDGKAVQAPAGTLLIEACKSVGIEVPSFCYYPNLSLQGACRMCLVKVEKMPKLQTACTTVVGEGMIVTTDSLEIHQARKSMVRLESKEPPPEEKPAVASSVLTIPGFFAFGEMSATHA